MDLTVVKVGGSLYDLPDLRSRLEHWFSTLSSERILLVPGGGKAADSIRHLDQVHRFNKEDTHWLALRALTLNAWFLKQILPAAKIISDAKEVDSITILDAFGFCLADDHKFGALPHNWDATSDSVAARVAVEFSAQNLILLKSVTMPSGISWEEACRLGIVDPVFPTVLKTGNRSLEVECLNFRELELPNLAGGPAVELSEH